MSLIDDIKRDRNLDPEPDMGWKWGPCIWDNDTADAAYILSNRKVASPSVARRIGRVPDIEAALLAADNLADAIDQLNHLGCQQSVARVSLALASYRDATK